MRARDPDHPCRRAPRGRIAPRSDARIRARAVGGDTTRGGLHVLPAAQKSLFHAKIVAGKRGYLGTGNLSIGGFEDNVEVGLPLDETDVELVWWLIDQLIEAELLQREELVA